MQHKRDESKGRGKKDSYLHKFLYIECRPLILHQIGRDYQKFATKYHYNNESVYNFIKWNYTDYLEHRDKTKALRYLSLVNCIDILERSGYSFNINLVLKDTGNLDVQESGSGTITGKYDAEI